MKADSDVGPSSIRHSPALRLVRELGVGALAGAAAGTLAGLGSRIVMRISGLAAGPEAIGQLTQSGNVVGDVTLGGTLAILILGGMGGALGGGIYVALRPWLAPLGRWSGLGFGLLMLAVSSEPDPASSDSLRFGPPLLNFVMFAALSPLAGVVLVRLVAALERYDAAVDPTRPVSDRRAAVSELIRIAGIGVLLFMALLGLITLLGVGVLAFVPVALVAVALGTRFYLAYAGDRTSLAASLRIVTAVLIVAVTVMWFARTASGIAEILR